MGLLKDKEMEKDANWTALCKRKGWKCSICGAPPTREEGAPSSSNWRCGHCEHVFQKDD